MANKVLKKIIARAQQLRKKHTGTAWKNLVKKAGAEYRNGKLGKPGNDSSSGAGHTQTSTKAHTAGNRTATTTKTITAHVKVGKAKRKGSATRKRTSTYVAPGQLTTGQLKSQLKYRLNEKIDKLVLRKYHATKKRDKNKIQKEISKSKGDLRKLS